MITPTERARELLTAEYDKQAAENRRKRHFEAAERVEGWAAEVRAGARDTLYAIPAIEAALRTRPSPALPEVREALNRAVTAAISDRSRGNSDGEYSLGFENGLQAAKTVALQAIDAAALASAPSHIEGATDDWLVRQLETWPTRIDPEKTTNVEYLMQEAAKLIRTVERETLERAAKVADTVEQEAREAQACFTQHSSQWCAQRNAADTAEEIAAAIRSLAAQPKQDKA